MVLARHEVYLHSALPRRVVEEEAHLREAADLDGTLAALLARKRAELGRPPTLCVLPCGQLTVPCVEGEPS